MIKKSLHEKYIIRRLGAMFYDSLIIIALLCVGTLVILPLNHGQAFSADNILYQIYLIALIMGFYIGFWCWRGQTLGLVAWKLRVVNLDNQKVSFKQALFRFIYALISISFFGIGFLWLLIDKNQQTLYEKLSRTKVIKTV